MKEDIRVDSTETRYRPPSMMGLLSGWARQGVESFFATQRILLDLVMRQNANAMNVLREKLTGRGSPVEVFTEAAGEGVSNFIAAQKILLQMAQRHNELVMTGIRERVGDASTMAAMTDLMGRSVKTFMDMQQGFLNIADKQTEAWFDTIKVGKAPKVNAVTEMAREAMENFIRAQQKFLDVVAEQVIKATYTSRETKAPKRTDLTELAREATDAFIEAQKKLLDVGGRQVAANLKAAGKTMTMLNPSVLLPWAQMARDGVQGFVDAEKAMLDMMLRAEASAEAEPPRRASRKAPRRVVRKTVRVKVVRPRAAAAKTSTTKPAQAATTA